MQIPRPHPDLLNEKLYSTASGLPMSKFSADSDTDPPDNRWSKLSRHHNRLWGGSSPSLGQCTLQKQKLGCRLRHTEAQGHGPLVGTDCTTEQVTPLF